MKRRRWYSRFAVSLVIFLMAAVSFVTAEFRHTHEGGDNAHSRARSARRWRTPKRRTSDQHEAPVTSTDDPLSGSVIEVISA